MPKNKAAAKDQTKPHCFDAQAHHFISASDGSVTFGQDDILMVCDRCGEPRYYPKKKVPVKTIKWYTGETGKARA
jgi:hypothetical protein